MTTLRVLFHLAGLTLSLDLASMARANVDADADLILHHGKIVTVDRDFSIRQALAVKGDRLIRVGTNEDVLKTRGPNTTVVDLAGKMVLPGLIDSHTHPTDACMTEFDHPIPEMETIAEVLDYIRARAEAVGPGAMGCRPPGLHHAAQRAALPDSRRARPGRAAQPRAVRDRARCVGQLAGAQTQRHRQGFPDRWTGQDRKGPAHRRADRHPPQLHPVHQSGAAGA